MAKEWKELYDQIPQRDRDDPTKDLVWNDDYQGEKACHADDCNIRLEGHITKPLCLI